MGNQAQKQPPLKGKDLQAIQKLYAQVTRLRDADEAEEDREYEALLLKRKAGKG